MQQLFCSVRHTGSLAIYGLSVLVKSTSLPSQQHGIVCRVLDRLVAMQQLLTAKGPDRLAAFRPVVTVALEFVVATVQVERAAHELQVSGSACCSLLARLPMGSCCVWEHAPV